MVKRKNIKKIENEIVNPNIQSETFSRDFLARAVQVTMPGVALVSLYNTVKFALNHKDAFSLETGISSDAFDGMESFIEDVDILLEKMKEESPDDSPLIH